MQPEGEPAGKRGGLDFFYRKPTKIGQQLELILSQHIIATVALILVLSIGLTVVHGGDEFEDQRSNIRLLGGLLSSPSFLLPSSAQRGADARAAAGVGGCCVGVTNLVFVLR